MRAVFYGIMEIHSSGYAEYVAEFLHCLRVDSAQRTGSLTVVVGSEFGRYGLDILYIPLPYRSLLGVFLGEYHIGMYAVTYVKDVVTYAGHQVNLLPTHVAVLVVTHILRYLAQYVDYRSGYVAAGTAGLARHTLTAVPDGVGAQQFLHLLLITTLYGVAYAAGVIVIELCSRAYGGTYTAVHAGLERVLIPDIGPYQINQVSHKLERWLKFLAVHLHGAEQQLGERLTAVAFKKTYVPAQFFGY